MRRAPGDSTRHTAVLCGVFFLSGAAALIFETLWFRLAGLAFGNGVWASALVLSSFMAGLALGNALAARHGRRIARPERLYAAIEVVVAVCGVGLVLLFPALSRLLAPLFRALFGQPALLNALRLLISFLLLMVPATAMGLTLPLLVKALLRGSGGFGRTLGRLYGWNTVGAVAGALLGETLLIRTFGVVGTGLWAGSFNGLAAVGALAVARGGAAPDQPRGPRARLSPRAARLLAASFLAGGVLLALEVVWFRFLQLFFPGTTLTFAVMLSIVLAGIGLGALGASAWFRRVPDAHRYAFAVALGSGLAALLGYSLLDLPLAGRSHARVTAYGLDGVPVFLFLMLPVSLLSGLLFSLVGHAAHEELAEEMRAAGLVTLANTVGAALGALLAGFLLIPRLGLERSLFALALTYGAVALLLLVGPRSLLRPLPGVLATAFLVGTVLFPFGRMERYLGLASAKYRGDGSRVIAVREGLTETIQYLRKDFLGKPAYYRLVTNGFSMSGTHAAVRRYLKLYVYWPVALHPAPRDALLIGFGTGSTAEALVQTRSLESIVVVDIAREILEMSDVVFPGGGNPLDDERVTTHVEDGRFYLQTTERLFDIVTSEPPPPKLAGVVNLYTREYFQLVHDRLRPGGVATYWLPVLQLAEDETKAVLRAFLDVFGDETTLWTACGLDWMLVGTRGASESVSAEHFRRQWEDPVVGRELRALGFEHPGQLGATFLMGAEDLRRLTGGSAALTDGFPQRLSTHVGSDRASLKRYSDMMETDRARERFERSPYVRRLWPEQIRAETLPFFAPQKALNRLTKPGRPVGQVDFKTVHALLSGSELRTPILWAFDSTAAIQSILDEVALEDARGDWRVAYHRAVRALAQRDYVTAGRLFDEVYRLRPSAGVRLARVFAACMAGRIDEARALVERQRAWFQADPRRRAFLDWASRHWSL